MLQGQARKPKKTREKKGWKRRKSTVTKPLGIKPRALSRKVAPAVANRKTLAIFFYQLNYQITLEPHDYCKKKNYEITNMPLNPSLRFFFYFKDNRVVTLCMVKVNFVFWKSLWTKVDFIFFLLLRVIK